MPPWRIVLGFWFVGILIWLAIALLSQGAAR